MSFQNKEGPSYINSRKEGEAASSYNDRRDRSDSDDLRSYGNRLKQRSSEPPTNQSQPNRPRQTGGWSSLKKKVETDQQSSNTSSLPSFTNQVSYESVGTYSSKDEVDSSTFKIAPPSPPRLPPDYASDDEDVIRAYEWRMSTSVNGGSSFAEDVNADDDAVQASYQQYVAQQSWSQSYQPNQTQPFFSNAPVPVAAAPVLPSAPPPVPSIAIDGVVSRPFPPSLPPPPPAPLPVPQHYPRPPPPHVYPRPPPPRPPQPQAQPPSSHFPSPAPLRPLSSSQHVPFTPNFNNGTVPQHAAPSIHDAQNSFLPQQPRNDLPLPPTPMPPTTPNFSRCITVSEVWGGTTVGGVKCETVMLNELPYDFTETSVMCLFAAIKTPVIEVTRKGNAHNQYIGSWCVALHPSGGGEASRVHHVRTLLDGRSHEYIAFLSSFHEVLVGTKHGAGLVDLTLQPESALDFKYCRLLLMNLPHTSLEDQVIIDLISDFLLRLNEHDELLEAKLSRISFRIKSLSSSESLRKGCAYLEIRCENEADEEVRDEIASLIVRCDGMIGLPSLDTTTTTSTLPSSIAIIPDPFGANSIEPVTGLVELCGCVGGIDQKEADKVKTHIATKCGLNPREARVISPSVVRVTFPGTGPKAQAAMQKLMALNNTTIPVLSNRCSSIQVSHCLNMSSMSRVKDKEYCQQVLDWQPEVSSWQELVISKSQVIQLIENMRGDLEGLKNLLNNCLVHVLIANKSGGRNGNISGNVDSKSGKVHGAGAFLAAVDSTAHSRLVWIIKGVFEVKRGGKVGHDTSSKEYMLKVMHGRHSHAIHVNDLLEDSASFSHVAAWIIASKLASCVKALSCIPSELLSTRDRQAKRKAIASACRKALQSDADTRTGLVKSSEEVSKSSKRGKKNSEPDASEIDFVAVGTVKRDRRTPQQVIQDSHKEAKAAILHNLFDGSDDEDNESMSLNKTNAAASRKRKLNVQDKAASSINNAKTPVQKEQSGSFADDVDDDSWGGGGRGDTWDQNHGNWGGESNDYWGGDFEGSDTRKDGSSDQNPEQQSSFNSGFNSFNSF